MALMLLPILGVLVQAKDSWIGDHSGLSIAVQLSHVMHSHPCEEAEVGGGGGGGGCGVLKGLLPHPDSTPMVAMVVMIHPDLQLD